MADTLVKPIEMAVPAVNVGQEPAKRPNQSVQRKIVRPLSLYPSSRILPAKPTLAAKPDLETELAEVRKAWRIYRSTNGRDAVYIYLSKVFQVVSRWQGLNCAEKSARAALRLRANAPPLKPDPFAIVIFCTSDPDVVDPKTRSKWRRALRYAVRTKPAGQRLIDFIKSKGGINECARRFARNRKIGL